MGAMGLDRLWWRETLLLLLAAALAQRAVAAPLAPSAVQAPEKLSWYGDPKAPDISGVWVRVNGPVAPGASKEGWMPWPPPLKSPLDAKWQQRVTAAAAGKRTDDPVQGCLPPGMPRFMTGTNGGMLIIQTPGRVMLYRDSAPVRRVWLDGRAFPKSADLESFSNGNARGHYEGRDLVTEVVGIKDQPIDSTGVPHSDDLKLTERFHRVDARTLRVAVTLDDPKAYARPMTSTVTYRLSPDPLWEPHEFICTPGKDYHPETYVR